MAKSVCYTNIYNALRKSYDSGRYEGVNDDWSVLARDPWGRAELHSYEHGKTLRTGTVIGCTSMTDFLKFASQLLLEKYSDWAAKFLMYEKMRIEALAFQNACDYLYYGEGYVSWVERGHNLDLDDERSRYVWDMALKFMAGDKSAYITTRS